MDIFKYVNRENSTLVIGAYTFPPLGSVVSTSNIAELDIHDGVLVDRYKNGVPFLYEYNPWHIVAQDSITLPKATGKGFLVDVDNPTYCWKDLTGYIIVDANSATHRPTFGLFVGNIKAWQFSIDDEIFIQFHLPHDWVPGTDLYIHTHWAHNSVSTPIGTCTWSFESSFAKGFNQAAYSNTVTTSVIADMAVPTRQHIVSETQLSGTGINLLSTTDLEVDGLILMRVSLTGNTSGVNPFLQFCDIHYQSTNIGTKNKAPGFYS
jgi:hypothetical protein